MCSYWHLVDAKAKMSGFDMHLYCKKVFYLFIYLFCFSFGQHIPSVLKLEIWLQPHLSHQNFFFPIPPAIMLVEILMIIPLDCPKSLLAGLHILFSSLVTTTIRGMVLGQVKVLGMSQLHLRTLNGSPVPTG